MNKLTNKLIYVICDHITTDNDDLDYPYYFQFNCDEYKRECIDAIREHLNIVIPECELKNIFDSDDLTTIANKYKKE